MQLDKFTKKGYKVDNGSYVTLKNRVTEQVYIFDEMEDALDFVRSHQESFTIAFGKCGRSVWRVVAFDNVAGWIVSTLD